MDDLISRKEAIDLLKQMRKDGNMVPWEGKDVFDRIRKLPPAQPEPHTGHWEPVGMAEAVGGEAAMWGSAIAYHVCSECREQALEEDGEEKLSDFCPHCGAKMEATT